MGFRSNQRHKHLILSAPRPKRPRFIKLVLMGLLFLVGTSSVLVTLYMMTDIKQITLNQENHIIDVNLPLLSQPQKQTALKWHRVQVTSGDSLESILAKWDVDPQQVHKITQSGNAGKRLSQLIPKTELRLRFSEFGKLDDLMYFYKSDRAIRVQRDGKKFHSQFAKIEYEKQLNSASGTIRTSLFEAAQQQGLSDALIMEMASIFAWDIDFALDIRIGDEFHLIYEELFQDGVKIRDGIIIAAEFINQGKVHRAIRYTDKLGRAGYYTPKGKNLARTFLRTPVKFSRVNNSIKPRSHQPLNRIRKHKGIDYVAARGTPVIATASGRVVLRSRKGGLGKTIIINHSGGYSTVYSHLLRYAKTVYRGSRISQGQVIGYVGASGLATAPHLHYEFRLNGIHRNPVTVRLPESSSIEYRFKNDYLKYAKDILAKLEKIKQPDGNLATLP